MSPKKVPIGLAPWALLGVAATWGAVFVLMKDVIDRQDVNSFLSTRFLLAFIILVLVRPKSLTLISRDLVTKGALLGFALGTGYIFQTFGLQQTTPAITGFITGLYVVITPLIAALFLKEKLAPLIWVSVLLATIGLGLLSIRGWQVGVGEIFLLIGAIFFALHIIGLGLWSRGRDAYTLALIQLGTSALVSGVATFKNGYQPPPDIGVWGVILFSAIFATAGAFVIQTWAQAQISATRIAVILTMEVVFAALFSVLAGKESLSVQIFFGGVLVLIAMLTIVLPQRSAA